MVRLADSRLEEIWLRVWRIRGSLRRIVLGWFLDGYMGNRSSLNDHVEACDHDERVCGYRKGAKAVVFVVEMDLSLMLLKLHAVPDAKCRDRVSPIRFRT